MRSLLQYHGPTQAQMMSLIFILHVKPFYPSVVCNLPPFSFFFQVSRHRVVSTPALFQARVSL